jgi:hypothetical protein
MAFLKDVTPTTEKTTDKIVIYKKYSYKRQSKVSLIDQTLKIKYQNDYQIEPTSTDVPDLQ